MKSHGITTVLTVFITTGLWMPLVPAAEVQHVQFGSTATVGCDLSYLHDTAWLKHDPEQTPTVVLSGSLREGRLIQGFNLSSRYSLSLVNRSLALRISSVEEGDLGLYYCVSYLNSHLMIGSGIRLQVSSISWFFFNHWYCLAVGFGFLMMLLAVCVTHWKTQAKGKKTTNGTSC